MSFDEAGELRTFTEHIGSMKCGPVMTTITGLLYALGFTAPGTGCRTPGIGERISGDIERAGERVF